MSTATSDSGAVLEDVDREGADLIVTPLFAFLAGQLHRLGHTRSAQCGRAPAGSTSRLMVLVCSPLEPQHNRNVQQPGSGTSVMLGPPAMVTTGSDLPNGRPSTSTLPPDGLSLASHSTLFWLPSTRGLTPA